MHKAPTRRAINITRSRARCLASLTRRLLYCLRCCIVLVFLARRVCRSMIAWTPFWLSSFRGCCGDRLLRCRQVVTSGRHGFFVKGSGIMWNVRCFSSILSAVSYAPPPCRRPFVLCLTARLLAKSLCEPCLPNGGRWLPRLRAPSMGGTRASHYLFVSTVDPILSEFHMWVIHDGPPLWRMCGNIWQRKA